jgi:hypothetical protein
VIVWPNQLKAINELATEKGLESITLIAMPISIEATVNYLDGTYKIVRLNHSGKEISG